MTVLPELHEARQLCKLRGLRVTRAREGVAKAAAEVEAARQQVESRQRDIDATRRSIESLQHDLVHSLAPDLPRWSDLAKAQLDRLADKLERAEYYLIEDEHKLESAQDSLQQARAELTRALAREDAVRGLEQQTRRAQHADRERRAERELEEQGQRRHDAPA
jgi:hypothetical protein